MESLPLIVIVGPTASGKTSLAIRLSRQYGGEIISADSRTLYRGMDIGAAKPTAAERQGVAHWGFDLLEPGGVFTAADFQRYAKDKIQEIRSRGNVPFLVGGTGLYINAVVFDYKFPGKVGVDERAKWEVMTIDQLHRYCEENNIKLPENKYNKRYVINTIARNGTVPRLRSEPLANTCIVGISTERNELRTRIATRVEEMFKSGVVDEYDGLVKKYDGKTEAMTSNIYPLIEKYKRLELSLDELKVAAAQKDWHLAKRQMTWFKRNEYIKWYKSDDAYTYLARLLDSLNKS